MTLNGRPWPYPKISNVLELAWQKTSDGYLSKSLYDVNGANLEMRYYPPGWKTSGPKQYASYDRWIYVLNGSLHLTAYEGIKDVNGKAMLAGKGQVVEIPAHAIFGGADTFEAGEIGAWILIWREQNGTINDLSPTVGQP